MLKKYKLRGFFKIEVVDEKTRLVEKSLPVTNNLILTQGKDFVAQRSFVENILYCAVGSGSSAPLLSDTGLANELARTNTVDGSVTSACLTSLSSNVYSLKKTFKFSTITSPVTYGEIGWSYSSSSGANLFSKALIIDINGNPSPVQLGVGKYLRVVYTLEITLTPNTSQTGSANISGWTTNGSYMLQKIGLRSITADGSLSYYDSADDCNEPSAAADFFLGTSSAALASFGSATDRSAGTNYVKGCALEYLGNGVSYKKVSFGKGEAVSSTLRSLGVGKVGSSTTETGFAYVFDANQTKGSEFLLPLKIIYSWS